MITDPGDVAIAGIEVDPVDVTGAGDTFGASFIHALNMTDDLVAAATFANAAAARAVTVTGARSGMASQAEILSFAPPHALGRLTDADPGLRAPGPWHQSGSTSRRSIAA